jgi:uncharacterized protein
MESNRALLEKLYNGLERHDHDAMADCYHPDATFADIAFDLRGREQIHAMWHMIAESDLESTYSIESCNARDGVVGWIADYTFTDTGRRVHNVLRSRLVLNDGLIVEHRDDSDPWKWGLQALGPVKGPLAWLVPAIRQRKAAEKLADFISRHPRYGGAGASAPQP